MPPIPKIIRPSLDILEDILNHPLEQFTNSKVHIFDGKLKLEGNELNLNISASSRDLWDLTHFDIFPELSFSYKGNNYIVPEGESWISSPVSLNISEVEKAIIKVQSFYSAHHDWERKSYLRNIQPLEDVCCWYSTFNTYAYKEGSLWSMGLLEVKFPNDEILQMYPYKYNGKNYLVTESLTQIRLEDFNKMVFAMQVGLGLFTNRIVLDYSFTFSSEVSDFTKIDGIRYQQLRESIDGQYSVFTSNIHWVNASLNKDINSYARNQFTTNGALDSGFIDWLYMDFFSSLCNDLYAHEPLRRAAVLMLEASKMPLEFQSGLYAVALECITSFLQKEKGDKGESPVDNKIYKDKVKPLLTKVLEDSHDKNLITDNALNILSGRLNNLNSETNTDKLSCRFAEFGYTLSKEDKEAIKNRNRFLHGGIIGSSDYRKQLDELYHCSLRLHKLCAILLLNRLGFRSYMLNLPVIYGIKEECNNKEPALIRINQTYNRPGTTGRFQTRMPPMQ